MRALHCSVRVLDTSANVDVKVVRDDSSDEILDSTSFEIVDILSSRLLYSELARLISLLVLLNDTFLSE